FFLINYFYRFYHDLASVSHLFEMTIIKNIYREVNSISPKMKLKPLLGLSLVLKSLNLSEKNSAFGSRDSSVARISVIKEDY
ncbi:hypothetical protein, partial [Microcoleus sp. AT3-A2]|uniref:hypothetical protein n=1 Tax=Microcoleus sp. AT3-A2 TaxID=2818610 RepID=UPI002FD1E3E4